MRSQAGSGALASARKDSAENSAGVFCVGRKVSASASNIELVFEVMAWNGSSEGVAQDQVALGQEVISVCDPQQPLSVGAALVTLDRALDALNAADVASVPAAVQAQALRALERAEAKHTAARARVLAAFAAQDGYEDDGQGSARMWLRWQTRVTKAAAAGTVGWMRRLAAHPVIAAALAEGEISASWARAVCGWSDRLPEGTREDADQILAAAAAGGAELADLAGLAQQMYERAQMGQPDADEDGLDDRRLLLDLTFGGAGRLTGDLTPGCAAAVTAVLEALGKPGGPEDTRTVTQRRHDALEEACRRLIASGMLPERAGQPTQALVHITLAQLRNLPGASEAEAAWRAAAAREHGWLPGPDAEAAACDATTAPVVTGHVDPAALDRLVGVFLAAHGHAGGPLARMVIPAGSRAATVAGKAGRAGAGAVGAPARPALPCQRRRFPGCAARCWPWPPTYCPAPAGWHRGCAARCWPGPARHPACRWMSRCRWTQAGPSRPSPRTCAARRPPATRSAPSPAATSPPACARSIT